MNHSSVLVSGQILQKSEKFFKSHVVLEGIGERRGGGGGCLPFESDSDGNDCGLGLGLW